jgi:hypothetical protein
VTLEEELAAARAAAGEHVEEGEKFVGVVPAEPGDGQRVYLCAYEQGEEQRWLALDAAWSPVTDRALIRRAVSIAALCELAEESAGGGDLDELLAQLAELRARENPEGIDEAVAAVEELQAAIVAPPRVASVAYLDAIGAAAARLERALGEVGGSPFAEAMKSGSAAAEDLAADVVRGYKRPLA